MFNKTRCKVTILWVYQPGQHTSFLQRSRFFKPHDRNLTVFFIGVFWWYIGRSLFKRIDKEKINLGPLTRSVPYVQSCFAFSEEKKTINRPIPANRCTETGHTNTNTDGNQIHVLWSLQRMTTKWSDSDFTNKDKYSD